MYVTAEVAECFEVSLECFVILSIEVTIDNPYVMLCCVVWCCVVLCNVVLCLSCYVTLRYVMLHYDNPYHISVVVILISILS
jgi:hypothetical protein